MVPALALAACGATVSTTFTQVESAQPLIVHMLPDGACALDGSILFNSGTMPVDAVNDTGDLLRVELLEQSSGKTYDDIVAVYDGVQQALDSGQPVPTTPPWLREAARLDVPAGQEVFLAQPMGVGSYAIVCGRIHPPEDLFHVIVLGPIDVTDS